ncbi:MAG: hypothetical protein IPP46_14740 [Bacteroidetes bacterium]|nr:hypothetical protein [Bacteroidota bacterium]
MNQPLDFLNQVQPATIPSGMYERIVHRIEAEKKMSFTGTTGKLVLGCFLLVLVVNISTLIHRNDSISDAKQLVRGMQLSNDNELYK